MRFRSIETLEELVGRYCWLEHRVFEMTGAWASDSNGRDASESVGADLLSVEPLSVEPITVDSLTVDSRSPVDAERRVWCAVASRRHGSLSVRWHERLPVRAGVDAAGLVTPPPGRFPALVEELAAAADPWDGLAGLVRAVLPKLSERYAAHLEDASAVSESPVMEVLVAARREALRDIRGGSALLQRAGKMEVRGRSGAR